MKTRIDGCIISKPVSKVVKPSIILNRSIRQPAYPIIANYMLETKGIVTINQVFGRL